jgi:Fe-S cluster biogenesis protein NfuA
MNLNTLAVNYDNGFQTKEAYMNLKHAVEKTGSAYISYRPPWDMLKVLYRDYTRNSGGDICGTCNMGVSHAVYKIADAEQVPLIIWGYSPKHENTPIYEGKRYCREKMYRNAIQGTAAAEYFDYLAYDHFKRRNKLLSIYLFNYIPYDEEVIKSVLKSEYGWKAAAHGSNKADCDIFKVSNYYKIRQNGYGRINVKYAALVRDGQMKKEKALQAIAERETGEVPAETAEVLGRIDLTPAELENAKGRRLDFVENVENETQYQELKESSGSVEERVALMFKYLEPEVKRDGGEIAFVKLEDNFLYFKLGGDCRGCFLQQVMTNYIDTLLVRFVPELKGSLPVYDLDQTTES